MKFEVLMVVKMLIAGLLVVRHGHSRCYEHFRRIYHLNLHPYFHDLKGTTLFWNTGGPRKGSHYLLRKSQWRGCSQICDLVCPIKFHCERGYSARHSNCEMLWSV